MAVWLGSAGAIKLQRSSGNQRLYAQLVPADVNATNKRFSFERSTGALITGDCIWVRRITESGQLSTGKLDFVTAAGWSDGTQHSDGRWFVHVDPVGGLRLYTDWDDALVGDVADAIALATPSAAYRISVDVVDYRSTLLAQVTSFELNTNRKVADTSSLGDTFTQQLSTTVSGSGSLDCLWDYTQRQGDRYLFDAQVEMAHYLHQLVLRQDLGSTFKGYFLLKTADTQPLSVLLQPYEENKTLFYECDCVITEAVVALDPEQLIHSKVSFVTTGQMTLRYDFLPAYLLQEQEPNDLILTEDNQPLILEDLT